MAPQDSVPPKIAKKVPQVNQLLRQARIEQGWTQADLAEKLGVDEQTVRSWERGTRFPSLKFRKALCDLFSRSLAQLGLQEKDEMSLVTPSLPTTVIVDDPTLPLLGEDRQSEADETSPDSVLDQHSSSHHTAPTEVRARNPHFIQSGLNGSSQGDENRWAMLASVRFHWITGMLEPSLVHAALIVLGLQRRARKPPSFERGMNGPAFFGEGGDFWAI